MSRRIPKTLVVAVVLAGCASSPKRVPGREYLAKIDVEGNRDVKEKYLTSGLGLNRAKERGRPPDPYMVDVDSERIKGEYVRRGYLEADVTSRVDRQGDAATVVFQVAEGARSKVRVAVYGLTDPALIQKVKDALPLKDGDMFVYEVYDEAKEALRLIVEDAGYAYVKLESQVIADRATNTAVITLSYDTGPKSRFGVVDIEGVTGDLREAVENRLEFTGGQQYSTQAIAQTTRNLYGLNRFSTVRVQPDRTDEENSTINMKVSVAESARREVKLGGGFGMDPVSFEVRGRAGYSIAGWPAPLQTVTLDFRPAYAMLRDAGGYEPRVKALARLERQDFLWTYAKGEVEGGYDYLAYEAYTAYGPRARLGFSTPLTSDRFQLRLGWQLQQVSFRNPHPLIDEAIQMEIGLDTPDRIGAFNQSLILDLRNNLIEPRYGAYFEFRASEGTPAAGGQFSYVQFVPEARGYVPLGPVTLALRTRAGATFGDQPVTTRFFSGGANSHRGFSDRKLAPGVNGEFNGSERFIPYGGNALLDAGLEFRIPITEIKEMPLGMVTFLDGGDVTEEISQIDPMNLHWAAGLGFRLHTIIGPVRLDVGYRLNRTGGDNPDPNSRFAFHLGIGEAF